MALLRLGELVSLAEAASIAGVTPQRVGQWCRDEGLDWRARRRAKVKTLWLQVKRKPGKRMTKEQRAAQTARLVAQYHAKKLK